MKIKSEEELQKLTDVVASLSALKFFPQQEQGLVAIVSDVAEMVSSMDHARWLVKRMRELYDEWPGPVTLRGVYCDRFAPEAPVVDRRYPQPLKIEEYKDPTRTYGPWPEDLLFDLKTEMEEGKKAISQVLSQVETQMKVYDFKPVTQADIDEALRRAREERLGTTQS